MKKEMQKESLEFIMEYDLTVQNFSDQIRWMGIDFMDLKFRQEENDGSTQKTLMDEIGVEMNPERDGEDDLRRSGKFKAELGKYVESQRKILKNKGVVVFNDKEELIKKHPEAKEVSSWDKAEYNKAIKVLTKTTKYAVVIDIDRWGSLEKEVYQLTPKKEKTTQENQPQTGMTEAEKADADKLLERSREEKLNAKASDYKHSFLVKRAPGILKLNTKAQRIVTIGQIASQIGWAIETNKYGQEAKKILGTGFENVKKLLECTPKTLDAAIQELNKAYLSSYDNKELEMIMIADGFKYDKETVVTKEFLELHSKDQLISLAKELKLETEFIEASKNAKKGELVKEFMTYELTGKVPKIVGKNK